MKKKCRLFHWFSLLLFFTSFQDAYTYAAIGVHSSCVVIAQPVIVGFNVAAIALTSIAHNAYQKYVENNKKEELEKIVKRLGKVIAARELEVAEAKEIIKGLENISQNQQNKTPRRRSGLL